MRAAASLIIVSTLAVLAVSSAARADTLSFRIYKEDDLIGHDTYLIVRDGDNVTVKVAMQTDTKLFFIPFHYRQDRTEIWKGGQLQSLLSDTDDDGEKHHVEVHRDADLLVGTADGENKSLLGDSAPFTLWSNELVNTDLDQTSRISSASRSKSWTRAPSKLPSAGTNRSPITFF